MGRGASISVGALLLVACGGTSPLGGPARAQRNGREGASSAASGLALPAEVERIAPVRVVWRRERDARWLGGGWLMDEAVRQTHDCRDALVRRRGAELQAIDLVTGEPRWRHDLAAKPALTAAGAGAFVAADTARVTSVTTRDGSVRWRAAVGAAIEQLRVVACEAPPCDVLLRVMLPRTRRDQAHWSGPRMPAPGQEALMLLAGRTGEVLWRRPCSGCEVVHAAQGEVLVRQRDRWLDLGGAAETEVAPPRYSSGRLLLRLPDGGGLEVHEDALRRIDARGRVRWRTAIDRRLLPGFARRPGATLIDRRRAFVFVDWMGFTHRGAATIATLGVWLDIDSGDVSHVGFLPGDVFQVFGAGQTVVVGTPQWLVAVEPPARGAAAARPADLQEVLTLARGWRRHARHVDAHRAALPGRFPYDTAGAWALLDMRSPRLQPAADESSLRVLRVTLAGFPMVGRLQRARRAMLALGRWFPESQVDATVARLVQLDVDDQRSREPELPRELQRTRGEAFAMIERSVARRGVLTDLAALQGWPAAPPSNAACTMLSDDQAAALWTVLRHLHMLEPARHLHVPELSCLDAAALPSSVRFHAEATGRRLDRLELVPSGDRLPIFLPRGDARWDAAPAKVFRKVQHGRAKQAQYFVARRVAGEWRVTFTERMARARSVFLLR